MPVIQIPPPLFGEPDGYNGDGLDADGYHRSGLNADGYTRNDYHTNGSLKELTENLNLSELWADFKDRPFRTTAQLQPRFLQSLRDAVRDPDNIDILIAFCDGCGDPEWIDELESARGDEDETLICESCWNSWTACSFCEHKYPASEITTLLYGGTNACEGCRDEHCTFCEVCDGYHNDDDIDHDHDDDGSCCSSPQPEFTVRNDGCEPLANDTRVTITLPAGTISAEGLGEIRAYLRRCDYYTLSDNLSVLGDQWQERNGNFTKRLSNYAYKIAKIKLSPEILSQIGCIARDHSQQVAAHVEVTRQLNLSSADFGNDGSCWWSTYSESRCALKTNGGFGLRKFSAVDSSWVKGRAWVMPLRLNKQKLLRPAFNTLTPDAFMVFNGYGELGGYAAPRIVAHMTGWTYRKIEFRCSPMWINNDNGYLIAPEIITQSVSSLILDVNQHSGLFDREQAAARNAA